MKLLKKYIAIILGVTLFLHILNAATAYNQSFLEYFFNGESILINLSYNVVIITFILTFYNLLEKKLSWEKDGIKMFFYGLIGSTLLVIIALILCQYIHSVLILEKQTSNEFFSTLPQKKNNFIFSGVISVCISLFFIAYGFIKASQEQKVKEQKIIANTATAKFDALRNQLDPHFLFNSLNVLTSLIYEDPDSAQKFTTNLARVYRYILEQKTKDLVSVKDEIKFGRTYISLLQKRFEDCLTVNFPKELDNPDGKIIPLSLQLLLENAVKHNIVNTAQPLHIDIFEKDGFLHIENNLQPKTVMQPSTGVGLVNIKTRYEMLRIKTFDVFKTKNAFIAKLPILNRDTTVINTEEMNTNIAYDEAQLKVKNIKAFYFQLIAFIIGMTILTIINFTYSPKHIWVVYPLLGWGLGILSQAFKAFGKNPLISKTWEEKRTDFLLEQNKIFGLENDLNKKMRIAKKQVASEKDFYMHLSSFIFVNIGLGIINYYQNQWNFIWFLFPLIGWFFGLASHALYIFRNTLMLGANWEEKQIEKILNKSNKKN